MPAGVPARNHMETWPVNRMLLVIVCRVIAACLLIAAITNIVLAEDKAGAILLSIIAVLCVRLLLVDAVSSLERGNRAGPEAD